MLKIQKTNTLIIKCLIALALLLLGLYAMQRFGLLRSVKVFALGVTNKHINPATGAIESNASQEYVISNNYTFKLTKLNVHSPYTYGGIDIHGGELIYIDGGGESSLKI